MSSLQHCVLNCEKNDSRKLLKFSEESLEQFREKLRIRIALNIKYCDVELPEGLDDTKGYHAICKRNFFSICKSSINKYKALQHQTTAGNLNSRVET